MRTTLRGSFLPRFLSVKAGIAIFLVAVCLVLFVAVKTRLDLLPLPASLDFASSEVRKVQILDRNFTPLTVTYQNSWNIHDYALLHEFPAIIKDAMVVAEDKRFYRHRGVDWRARAHALKQNIRALRAVRGASTITEQVVRMLHPRPRTVWSRWLEGVEAGRLESKFSKEAILEFYLNQVPYAAKRRGVVQAAFYYFDRDIDTLSTAEALSLAVLVRAPGRMDLRGGTDKVSRPLTRLAARMREAGLLSADEYDDATTQKLIIADSGGLQVRAAHFVNNIYNSGLDGFQKRGRLVTTLNGPLQSRVQKILDSRLSDLATREVSAGAVLVIDHGSGQVLAWVNGAVTKDGITTGGAMTDKIAGSHIDAVTTPRQPGSALKPFVYAMAIEKGWTAATIIDDSPLLRPVGAGLHAYHNYSRVNYGPVRLREALGNSLNIPAVRTVQFVGVDAFLKRLRKLGFTSLARHPVHYGEGLSLGNGEVTLFELVRAYATLARGGRITPLRVVVDEDLNMRHEVGSNKRPRVFSPETTSIIADILSDPEARRLEFGGGNLLRFPAQTAVKTGTSTDYRDAWAIGFSSSHTVGVWMGNLDQRPTGDVTGSIGPALVLRAVFAELNRIAEPTSLYLSQRLTDARICRVSGELAAPDCPAAHEWFEPGRVPGRVCSLHGHGHGKSDNTDEKNITLLLTQEKTGDVRVARPTPGLQMAMNPRIPDELEAFGFAVTKKSGIKKVEWVVDGVVAGVVEGDDEFLWRLRRGTHTTLARVWQSDSVVPVETEPVKFYVK